jgi:hypothetical protein
MTDDEILAAAKSIEERKAREAQEATRLSEMDELNKFIGQEFSFKGHTYERQGYDNCGLIEVIRNDEGHFRYLDELLGSLPEGLRLQVTIKVIGIYED